MKNCKKIISLLLVVMIVFTSNGMTTMAENVDLSSLIDKSKTVESSVAASFILSPIYSFPMSAPAIMMHKTKSTDNRIFNPLFFIISPHIPHTLRMSTVCALAPIRSALSHVER